MDSEKVLQLATLARIKLAPGEAETLSHEFEAILKYVGEIKEVASGTSDMNKENFPVRNVMRKDTESHESGIYTEMLLNEAPAREGQYIKVKKIL